MLVSQQPIAEPGDERARVLDEDVARASEAGAEVALSGPVSVREPSVLGISVAAH